MGKGKTFLPLFFGKYAALFFVIFFLATVIFLSKLTLERIENQTREKSVKNLTNILFTAYNELYTWSGRRKQHVSIWATSPAMVRLTKTQLAVSRNRTDLIASPALVEIREFFRPKLLMYDDIDISLISPDFINIASMQDSGIGDVDPIGKEKEDMLAKVFQGNTMLIPPLKPSAHFPHLFIVAPVIEAGSNDVIAALALHVHISHDLGRIADAGSKFGETAETYFFDEFGRLLTESRFLGQLRTIGLIGPHESSSLLVEIRDPGGNIVEGFVPKVPRNKQPLTYMARHAIDGKDGEDYRGYRDYRGVTVLGTWMWSEDMGIGTAVEIDVEEVLRSYHATRTIVIVAVGLTTILSLTLSLAMVLVRKRAESEIAKREKRYRAISEQMPDALFLSDFDDPKGVHKIIEANNAATLMHGYTSDELLGQPIEILPDTESSKKMSKHLAELQEGEVRHFEVTHLRKDGSAFPVAVTASLRKIEGKRVIISIIRNIAERKKAEEKLKEREERLRSITSSINDAIIMVDREGRITFWNNAAEKIFHYSSDEIIGKHLHEKIIPPEYRDAHVKGVKKFMVTGQGPVIDNTVELEGLRKNGDKFPLELSLSAIKIKGSWNAIGTIRDLTERKHAEEELRNSKEQLTRIVETVVEGLYIVSREGRIIFANNAAEKMFGLPREELYKRTFNDPRWAVRNLDGSLVDKDEHPFEIVKKTKKPVYGVELLTQRQDGGGLIISINAAPFFDSSGAFQGMVATEQDITKKKSVEKEIRDAHRDNEQLLEALPSVLISLDSNYRVSKWNTAAENVFGIPVKKATGRRFDECDIKWNWDKIQEVISICEKTGESVVLDDIKYVRADTKDGFFSLTVNPVQYDTHAVTGFLILGRDTTEKMVLESQLAQAQKLESIGSLAAGIAHEINTPTQFVGDNIHFLEGAFKDIQTMLDKYDQLLEASKKKEVSDELINEIEAVAEEADKEFLSGEIPKAIQSSLRGLGRVTTIVKAMKDFSHPGAKEKILVDINRLIESTVTISRNEWKYVSDMVTNFEPSLGLVPCYPDEFNQVILNLITNASHAIGKIVTEGLQDKGTITIETRKENDQALITVSDTGTGMPDSIKDKIFDHFFTTKEVGRGTGQGLSISRTIIVEKHHGSLSVDTEEGKGTTFFIRLPLNGG